MPHHVVAFRCKCCGWLEHAGHAGESEVPHACRVCQAGVIFMPTVQELSREICQPELSDARRKEIGEQLMRLANNREDKKLDPSNWEILADCTPERLAELGLEPHHCEKHAPVKRGEPAREPRHIVAEARDGIGTKNNAG